MITLSINGFSAVLENERYSVSRGVGTQPDISISGNIATEMTDANIVGSTLVALLEQKGTHVKFLGHSFKPSSYYTSVEGKRVYFSANGIAVSLPSVSEEVTDAAKKTHTSWSATGLTSARRAYTFDWGDGDTLAVNVKDILGSNPVLGIVMRKDGRHSGFHRNSAMAAYVERIIFEDGLATK